MSSKSRASAGTSRNAARSPQAALKAKAAASKKPKLRSVQASKVRRGNEAERAGQRARANAGGPQGGNAQRKSQKRRPKKKKKLNPLQKFLKKVCGAPPRVEINRRSEEVARATMGTAIACVTPDDRRNHEL